MSYEVPSEGSMRSARILIGADEWTVDDIAGCIDEETASSALLAACEKAMKAMGKIPFATTPEAPYWQEPMLAAYAECEAAIALAKGESK